jgi:hypothetical protein
MKMTMELQRFAEQKAGEELFDRSKFADCK